MNVPEWAVNAAKFVGTVACAVAIGYARFVNTENKVDQNRGMILEMQKVDLAQTTVINEMDRRLVASETAQKINHTSTKDSLDRIEVMLKDVRAEIRDLQAKAHPPIK